MLLFVLILRHTLSQRNRPQLLHPPVLRPVHGSIVHRVAFVRQLHLHPEPQRAFPDSLADFLKQKFRPALCRVRIAQMLHSRFGHNAIPSIAAHSTRVYELHRGHAKIFLFRKTRRRRLGRLHKSQRRRMRSQKFFNRGRRPVRWIARARRSQHLQKFLPRPRRKTVG